MTSSNSRSPRAAAGRAARSPSRALLVRAAEAVAGLGAVLVAWQAVHHWLRPPDRVLPAPTTIVASAAANSASLGAAAATTAVEGAAGMVVGIVVGMIIAFTSFLWPRAGRVAAPVLVVSQTVPLVAVAPLMVIWMGFGMASKIVVVAVFTAFPVALALLRGLGRAPGSLTDPLVVAGAPRGWVLVHTRLPWALSDLFSGIRIAATYAFATAATAEFMGAKRGLGIFLLSAQASFRTDLVLAAAATLVVMTLLLYACAALAEAAASHHSLPGPRRPRAAGGDIGPGEITVSGLVKTFHSAQGRVRALGGADLVVPAGRIAAVVGPSGCGKSTLIRVIAGLDRADADAPGAHRTYRTGAPGPGSAALMPQSDSLAPWLSVRDNVALPLVLAGAPKNEARAAADGGLADLGLGGFASHKPEELSGGMRARVAFARTMLTPASAILLDEPFGALDALTRARVCDWLAGVLHDDPRTAVIVTHDILEAVQLADEVHVMSAPGASRRPSPSTCPAPAATAPEDSSGSTPCAPAWKTL